MVYSSDIRVRLILNETDTKAGLRLSTAELSETIGFQTALMLAFGQFREAKYGLMRSIVPTLVLTPMIDTGNLRFPVSFILG